LQHFNNGDTVNVYVDTDVLNGIDYKYYIAAYDSGNGIIGPLENTAASKVEEVNNTVQIRPEVPIATESLNQVKVVPNPYRVTTIRETGWNEHAIQFTGLLPQ
jgi:hypothetical protein